jgi:exodeoxyribonuclease V alpha subunit
MEAITMAMRHPVSILTGGPGTGKTFAVRVAVELWRKQGKRVLLAAPTGRAAARMNEMFAGDAKATTVHKLLECGMGGGGGDEGDVMAEDELWSWSFRRNERSPVDADGKMLPEVLTVFPFPPVSDVFPTGSLNFPSQF